MKNLSVLSFTPSNSSYASLNIGVGVAPSTPDIGDVWNTGSRLQVQSSSGTKSIAYLDDIVGGDMTAIDNNILAMSIVFGGTY